MGASKSTWRPAPITSLFFFFFFPMFFLVLITIFSLLLVFRLVHIPIFNIPIFTCVHSWSPSHQTIHPDV